MKKPVIFLSTIEFSGDMHGEVLIRELKQLLPEAEFYGIGGTRMAAAGMEIFYDPAKKSTIGFVEVIRNLRKMSQLIKEVGIVWKKRRPDLVIWLDSGGFNLKLAKEAKQRGIPVVCMFSPSAWAYWKSRAYQLAERVQLLLAVLPFEEDFYRKCGTNVTYVGHPLVDRVGDPDPALYRKELGLGDGQKLVALLPGSRRQEILHLLPVMLEVARDLNRDLNIKWVLPVAASVDQDWIESICRPYEVNITLITDRVYHLLAAADGAVIASGTATLEAGILNTPMVIIYQISKLSFSIYKLLETKEHKANFLIGLPNLIMGRLVVPELTQENMTTVNIAGHLRRILTDERYQSRMRQELRALKTKIGPPGVMKRAAQAIAGLLEK